tara:strand:- start:152 stop:346 length:195 start_codon:yes stop_codon:yes gene_type:complete
MIDLAASNTISPLAAVLWCFYPIGALVLLQLVLSAFSNDDDDDQGGGKMVGVAQPQLQYIPSGA